MCAALIKEWQGKLSRFVPLFGILGISVLSLLRYGQLVTEMLSFADRTGLSALGILLVKILALSYLSTLAADVCRDLGEGATASRLEICGRLSILLAGLPFLLSVFEEALSYVA